MTTYSKETALYDTGAIATDITEASQTADRYITYVDAATGIQVHNAEDDDNYVQINSDGMEVYRDDASVATFGTEARIGPLNDAEKVVIGSGGVSMYTADNAEYFKSYVDDVNLKTININYSTILSRSIQGMNNIPKTSLTYNITDKLPISDWNAVSSGDKFYLSILLTAKVKNGGENSKTVTISVTKGTDATWSSSVYHTYDNIQYRTIGYIDYDAANDTIKVSVQGTVSNTSKIWTATCKVTQIIYPKQVPWPKVQIDGDLIVSGVRAADTYKYETDWDPTTAPSSNIYKSMFETTDVNDDNMAYVGCNYQSDGLIASVLGLHRNVNGSDIYHTFGLNIDSAGKKNYDAPMSTSVSGSSGALYFYRWGDIVYVSSNGAWRSKSTSISSGTTLTQTIPNGYKPVCNTYISCAHNASANWRLEFYANGNISFLGTSAWNANMWISGMWITQDNF